MPHLKKSPANERAKKMTMEALAETFKDLGKGLRKSTVTANEAASVAAKVSKVSTDLRRRAHKLPKSSTKRK